MNRHHGISALEPNQPGEDIRDIYFSERPVVMAEFRLIVVCSLSIETRSPLYDVAEWDISITTHPKRQSVKQEQIIQTTSSLRSAAAAERPATGYKQSEWDGVRPVS